MFIVQSACELIGHTPMLELKKIIPNSGIRILVKMETKNPTSIKDRAVHSMIRAAIKQRKIIKKTEVVEVSSGNTAIALASIGTIMGFKVRVFMSELSTQERRQILSAYGAKIVLTPAAEHTKGAGVWVAEQLAQRPGYKNKTIVCFFCDTGERYLSEPGLFPVGDIEYID